MILNKSSYERGFGHASVYKTKVIDLAEERKRNAKPGSGTGGGGLKFGNFTQRGKLHKKQSSGGGEKDDDAEEDPSEEVKVYPSLDDDGLPNIGDFLEEGDPLVCVVDELTGTATATKHKENEPAFVQCIRALGAVDGGGGGAGKAGSKRAKEPLSKVAITLRFPRNPIIGDKFSSRHGQKGVMSILWPAADMPFR